MSSASLSRIGDTHQGIDGTSPARRTRGIDFECGFQSSMPNGPFERASGARRLTVEVVQKQSCQVHRASNLALHF
jgi:hypothetical protein